MKRQLNQKRLLTKESVILKINKMKSLFNQKPLLTKKSVILTMVKVLSLLGHQKDLSQSLEKKVPLLHLL